MRKHHLILKEFYDAREDIHNPTWSALYPVLETLLDIRELLIKLIEKAVEKK